MQHLQLSANPMKNQPLSNINLIPQKTILSGWLTNLVGDKSYLCSYFVAYQVAAKTQQAVEITYVSAKVPHD